MRTCKVMSAMGQYETVEMKRVVSEQLGVGCLFLFRLLQHSMPNLVGY